MRTAPRALAPIVLAVVGVALLVIVLSAGSSGYLVRAEFGDADGLTKSFEVREDGVVVGTVTDVAVTRRDTAMVTMRLDPAAAPVGAGATVSIHPSNLLGEKYVQISPGNQRQPLASGTLIPLARTSVSPELDQVLDTFNGNTRKATAVFLAEQGNALLGRGADLATTLQELPGSLDATRQFISGLAQDNAALGRLIDQSSGILTEVTPQRAALGHLVTRADGFFSTLASREAGLQSTVAQAPGMVAQLRSSLDQLQGAAVPLGLAADGLRTTAPALTRSLRAIPGFTAAATPTLHTLIDTAPTLARLGSQATPLVAALQPAAAKLATFASVFAPFSTLLHSQFPGILNVLEGWARAIEDRDGVGHIYRIEVTVPTSVITGALGSLSAAPKAGAPAHRGTSTPSAPGLSSVVQKVLPTKPSKPVITVPTVPTVPAPTAVVHKVGSLLNYLLGR